MQTIIVFPCYNEENRIDKQSFIDFAQANNDIRLLFVDDGSTDHSLSILKDIKAHVPIAIDVISLDKNSGKAEAVRCGLVKALESNPKIIGYADIDLATPLQELRRLTTLLDNKTQKVLLGSRVHLLGKNIQRKKIRHYLGRVFATITSVILHLDVYDTQCGAKFFQCAPELKLALDQPFKSRWIFDVELIKRLQKNDLKPEDFIEEPLNQWIDMDGSKLGILAMIKAMFDLLKI